nr:MAG TPA: hypothetical protein [Caudoviricetes sp.]
MKNVISSACMRSPAMDFACIKTGYKIHTQKIFARMRKGE